MLDALTPQQRSALAGRWFERISGAYPAETATFLRSQQDRFANPVGAALREETVAIVNGLLDARPPEELKPALDRIIRIRAVQDMPASQAVGFLFELKQLIRNELASGQEEPLEPGLRHEALVFEQRIDRLALAAFDVYMACREQVYKIRVDEIKNRSLIAMERLNEWRADRWQARDQVCREGPETTERDQVCRKGPETTERDQVFRKGPEKPEDQVPGPDPEKPE